MSKKSQSEILQEKLAKLNGNNAAQNPNQDEVEQAYEPHTTIGNKIMKKIAQYLIAAIIGFFILVAVVAKLLASASDYNSDEHKNALQECYDQRSESKSCKREYRLALTLAPKGCDNGIGADCNTLAVLYEDGVGTEKNIAKAQEYYKRACQLGGSDHNACILIGEKYFLENDHVQAAKYFSKGCNSGKKPSQDGVACRLTGSLYLQGEGVEQNTATAMQYFEKGCQFGDEEDSCYIIGSAYLTGLGVSGDEEKALTYLTKSCNAGNQEACSEKEIFFDEK